MKKNYLVVESFDFPNKTNEKKFISFDGAWGYIERARDSYAETMEGIAHVTWNKEAGYASVYTSETDDEGNVSVRGAEWQVYKITEEN